MRRFLALTVTAALCATPAFADNHGHSGGGGWHGGGGGGWHGGGGEHHHGGRGWGPALGLGLGLGVLGGALGYLLRGATGLLSTASGLLPATAAILSATRILSAAAAVLPAAWICRPAGIPLMSENNDGTIRKIIGVRVQKRRLSAGLSQAQLGRKIGRADTFIAALEGGRVVFTEDLLSGIGFCARHGAEGDAMVIGGQVAVTGIKLGRV